ncbi:unnamed protein product [Polarella glacialis]|uniref:Sulfotransferase n=1 Tax=Polarella glacialis TaxID=89957 RepID=A0A813HHA4_POLGL|nr:unnamed protein product [Polarella glacialis]
MGDPCQIDPETISRWGPHAAARCSKVFWAPPRDVRWCPFRCWRRVASVAGSIVCTTSGYVMLNEHVEHGIFKSYTLHSHWELAGSQARLPNGTADSPLLVFQHIPRTSGDSMQTHLFRDKTSAFSSSSPWPHEFSKKWAETFLPAEDLEKTMEPSTKLIKGYYSRRDLQTIKRSKKVFTFLRHPVERVLSLFHMIKPKCVGVPLDEVTFLEKGNNMCISTFGKLISTCAYPWDYSCTFALNSMTWQLGGDQHCASRSAADANEVLARAKQALEEAAFVGFYETLDADFWALKENIFPGVQLPRYVPAAFWLGAWLSLPRLRVLKFSAGLSDDALDCIRQHLDLDLELYEWALKRFKPDLVLYTSYRGFFWGHPCYTLTLGFLLLLLTSACQYCCRLCGRAAPRESSAARGQPS